MYFVVLYKGKVLETKHATGKAPRLFSSRDEASKAIGLDIRYAPDEPANQVIPRQRERGVRSHGRIRNRKDYAIRKVKLEFIEG